ncbi:stage VI sporulation protein D [Oceanobacillus sp. CF4.6]|uniref:stage VI sporulation protein D n=1 Tax=Oceanobacillus sp. CF4.6 TaxID=3373080 RepID=UPI003EE55A43
MAGDSKTFTFELQESLFFEKGQEVAEMKGISLEPEISIQPYDEYISIRGIIELRGEYEKINSGDSEDELMDFEDFQAKRYVEKVIEENGVTMFSHRFPVEISVPPYRVADLDEVTVNIESFDYEIPESSQLKLYASIEIHGINSDAEKPREEKEEGNTEEVIEEENTEEVMEEFVNDEENSFEFEIRKQKEDVEETEDMEEIEEEVEATEVIEEAIPMEDPVELSETGVTRSSNEDPDRWKVKSQTLSEFFNQLPEGKEASNVEEEVHTDVISVETDKSIESTDDDYEQLSVEDATYLSDIFRNTEEESFTKMKLCIVQDQDTIETIAQRFSISPLQLIKHNDLEADFEVHEGQLLYIPANN